MLFLKVSRPFLSESIVHSIPKVSDPRWKTRSGTPVVCACEHLSGRGLPFGWPQA